MCSYAFSVHCSGVGEELERQNWEKFMGQGKEHYISEGKRKKKTNDVEAITPSLLPADQWPHTVWTMPALQNLPCFITGGGSINMEHFPGQCSSAALAASPPSLLATPSLLPGEGRVRSRGGLRTGQALLSVSQSTGVLPTLLWSLT